MLLKIIYEANIQAFSAMWGNKLRTFLSLLGITIGIFCIISVKSAVDSLQDNILDAFSELGSDVVYIDKQPWNEDPEDNYWKYQRRPNPSYDDFEVIGRKSKKTAKVAYTIFTGGHSIKYKSNSVSNAFIMGSTFDFQEIQQLTIEKGRYFTNVEYDKGSSVIILGSILAENLFGTLEPVGREVKLFGQTYHVIGVLKAEGENMFNFLNFDDVMWISYNNLKRFVNTNDESSVGKMLNVRAMPGVALDDLKGELTGILRSNRKLKPAEENNFEINELSMLSTMLEEVFGIINFAGFLIGAFSLVVGMFSVANIMFVSVKERTPIIGIKKAIGAKKYMILLEFLIESVSLCLVGGMVGILLVFLVLKAVTAVGTMEFSLSLTNVLVGVVCSIIVGVLSGVIPALKAANMDPVEAIRA